jgi:serine/threonine protein kinase
MAISPQNIFGPYVLGNKLGTGDMGTVYQAQHQQTQDTVAIKVIDQFDLGSDMRRGATVEVLEFVSQLEHKNLYPITQVLESADGNGRVGIVMPIAKGRSLYDHLNAGKMIPRKNALMIVAGLAGGLQFLHQQEVAHGSVKPTNVLLHSDGTPALTDLAMAHLRGDLGLVPQKPTLLQEYYLPPEVMYHAPPEIRGDIFGLGVISYHLLTGDIPFDNPDYEARHALPPQGDLPPNVYYVLLRAITHRTSLRYQNIAAFMMDFKGAWSGEVDPETVRLFKVEQQDETDDLLP